MTRQQDRKADTRARLVAAAAECFAERGVDAVSVDAVADAAGRTSGAVYAHFGSKQGLVLAVLDQWRQSLVGGVLAELAGGADLDDDLRAVVNALVVSPSPATCRLLQMEDELRLRATRDPEVASVLARRTAQHRRWLARGLAAWVASGRLPAGWEPEALAAVFTATVTGLAHQARLDPGSVSVDAAVAALTAVLTAPPPGASVATRPTTPPATAPGPDPVPTTTATGPDPAPTITATTPRSGSAPPATTPRSGSAPPATGPRSGSAPTTTPTGSGRPAPHRPAPHRPTPHRPAPSDPAPRRHRAH